MTSMPTPVWMTLPRRAGEICSVPGETVIRTPDGRFLRAALDDVPDADARAELAARLRPSEQAEPTLVLLGGCAITTRLAGLLETLGLSVRTRTASPDGADADLLVRVGLHEALDPAAAGCPVVDVRVEGALGLVHPVRLDAADPTSDQVDRRRLAASPAADHLQSWWDHGVNEPDLDDVALAALCAWLVRIARAVGPAARSDDVDAVRNRLWLVDSETARVSTHVVLGFDEPAPPPEAAR